MTSNGKPASGRVPLSAAYQYKLVAAVLSGDPRALAAVDLIAPEHFSARGVTPIWETIRACLQTYGHPPTRRLLREELFRTHPDPNDRAFLKGTLARCRRRVKDVDLAYLLKHARDFAGMQQITVAIREAFPLIERGDLPALRELLGRALLDGNNGNSGLGHRFVEKVKDRVQLRRNIPREVIRTLIPKLDQHLRNGGLRQGETGCVLANSGVGKTRFLLHLAKAAALQKKRVVYYTLQLPEEDIAEALDASVAGVRQLELVDRGAAVIERVERFGRLYGDAILIKYYPRYKAGPHTIENHLQQLDNTGWTPDLVIIDFMNYLVPSYAATTPTLDQRYMEIQAAMSEWIGLCQRRRIRGWTAFQANRAGKAKENLTIEDFAESYAAAMEATLVVSIMRTPEEKKRERARLHLAKYTYGGDGHTLKVHTNYEKGSFYAAETA